MIKNLIFILLFLSAFPAHVQDEGVYITSQCHIEFISDAQLELIQAESDHVLGALNTNERSFAFRIPIREFEGFNTSLQKTHFNDEFMESDVYPNASFSGKIIEEVDLSVPGRYTVRAKGKLNIHGVVNDRIIRCRVTVADNSITVKGEFTVFLDDHNITIPSILNQKIAEEIKVNLEFIMKEK